MRALGYLVGAFFAGLIGMVVWSFMCLGLSLFGMELYAVQTTETMTASFIVGAGAVIAVGIARAVRESNAEAAGARAAVIRAEQAKSAEIESLRNSAVWQVRQAVEAFGRMPAELTLAAQWYERATITFSDGAFSPFWSAIESAYGSLGRYNQDAQRISGCADMHRSVATELASKGALTREIAEFPVTMDTNRVKEQHDQIVSKLDAIVYQAQRQPTFATIWEQRRTTAAVIAGFANLESAVHGMRSALSASLDQVGASVNNTTRVIANSGAQTLSAIGDASAEQQRALRELNQRATEVRDHLYHPDLARWLH